MGVQIPPPTRHLPARTAKAPGAIFGLRGSRSGWERYTQQHPERAALYASSAWKYARWRQLRDEPDCRACGEPATHVDHIVPIAEGGADVDPANLQSLCKRHHGPKTLAESHRGAKRAAQRRKNPP